MTEIDPDNEEIYHVCVVSGDPGETSTLKKTILSELERCSFSEQAAFAVRLALEEALCNAVKHGCQDDPSKPITVRYAVTPERAVIIVRDEGGGFQPEEIPDPTDPDRLPLPCGRGIMLMRAYMDEVEYRDNGREVYFVKHRR